MFSNIAQQHVLGDKENGLKGRGAIHLPIKQFLPPQKAIFTKIYLHIRKISVFQW